MAGSSLQNGMVIATIGFVVVFVVIFLHHEHSIHSPTHNIKRKLERPIVSVGFVKNNANNTTYRIRFRPDKPEGSKAGANNNIPEGDDHKHLLNIPVEHMEQIKLNFDGDENRPVYRHNAKRGLLFCNGEKVDSEIIYWRIVPGDQEYESPITPHHDVHDDRYLTFEYDQGGWNNVRMGMESLIVFAHATGRTIVIPPQQHLYLLSEQHSDKANPKTHDEMGFEDFFDLKLLRSHKGFHFMEMKEFMEKEAVTGGLRGILPPNNSSKIWGQALWDYFRKVADEKPMWLGRFVAFPSHTGDFELRDALQNPRTAKRLSDFSNARQPVFYDQKLQNAHHIHFLGGESYRILQHHYAWAFFADPKMQSFYRRFVRDYIRYKDEIQCAGAELVGAVRADARKILPSSNGEFYALHVRRGDFQFKEVKISAAEIVQNLHFPNGTAIIPNNSVVYISTDDPDGLCKHCLFDRKPCESYPVPKPIGCPEDVSKLFIMILPCHL